MPSSLAAHAYWQELYPPDTFAHGPGCEYSGLFPAILPDGRQIALPIRPLGDEPGFAVASLIISQASFAVEDALSDILSDRLWAHAPDVIVAVPTLGLTLAANVARRLGHQRMVPLGTTRKFWYDDALSEPSSSISSRGSDKRIYLDPRMLPLLEGRRIAVVDDVVSTGTSLTAILRLLAKAGAVPAVVGVAMIQSRRWQPALAEALPGQEIAVEGAFSTPLLKETGRGTWTSAE
ncbi:phosphoribosyltransferase [Hartmannibacter diazotrophicus]|uniref:Phosphoribosyltransferase n=1 Tax=Hartmannibacter diazotrophicus TaxID=1482074 RepID=A0A2C9D9K9_9HYPH|nr:phosphoribosyltransferase [Hartmannibacter diazotrophicus]SON56956.1 phosphoribosyltransferase [Hartmannibacter diazotrophicus]